MFVIFEDEIGDEFAIQARDVVKVETFNSESCEISYKYGSLLLQLRVPKTFEEVVDMLNEAMSSSDE